MLFNIALHSAITSIDQRGTIFTKSTQICAFADDILIISRTKNRLVQTVEELTRYAKEIGLEVNENKTNFMIMSTSEERRQRQNLIIGGKVFKGTNSYTYLGNEINNKCEIHESINRQIQNGNKAVFANNRLLKSKLISRNCKMQIYKTLIRPIITYGSETWVLSNIDENILKSFEYRVLRRIFGAIYENNAWRKRYNHEIERLIKGENILRFIKAKRIQWMGHVQRMKETGMCKKIMNGKIYSNRRRGRPKLRWIDQVEKDLEKMKVKNWKRKSGERATWNSIVEKAKAHQGL